MEPDDGGDEFPDGASPAALQRILRKLGAGLDLLSPSGALESTINTLSINRTLLRTFFHAGHPRMKQLLGDLKADGDDERQVPSRSLRMNPRQIGRFAVNRHSDESVRPILLLCWYGMATLRILSIYKKRWTVCPACGCTTFWQACHYFCTALRRLPPSPSSAISSQWPPRNRLSHLGKNDTPSGCTLERKTPLLKPPLTQSYVKRHTFVQLNLVVAWQYRTVRATTGGAPHAGAQPKHHASRGPGPDQLDGGPLRPPPANPTRCKTHLPLAHTIDRFSLAPPLRLYSEERRPTW